MAYSQKELRLLGRIVANHERKPVAEVYADYENHLYSALARMPRLTSNINVLTHVMGHFSKVIKPEEKRFLLDSMHRYREGRIPLSVPLNLLRSCAIRFENEYVKNQAFFEPYPRSNSN